VFEIEAFYFLTEYLMSLSNEETKLSEVNV